MWQAVDLFETLPMCNRVIKDLHQTLLSDVRGYDKSPGLFLRFKILSESRAARLNKHDSSRSRRNCSKTALSHWEAYIHDSAPDALVQLSIVHAEFESLHLFLDGNGRIGRMLIPLFLFEKKLLRKPTFYISAYLEANRDENYYRLLAVSRDDDWTGWCEFFLRAIQRQAVQNAAKAREILALYDSRKEWVVEETHSQHAIRALDFVFRDPVFIASEFIHESNIPTATARRILNILSDKGLLSMFREGSGRRPAIYAFTELINIVEGREGFHLHACHTSRFVSHIRSKMSDNGRCVACMHVKWANGRW